MNTRKPLDFAMGGFLTKLAEIGDDLVKQAEEREASRMADAESRAENAGKGPIFAALQRALIARQTEQLTDNRLPAIMTYDAYCVVKDASKASPDDRGLKVASYALYDAWNRDPMGHLTVGQLASYRNHYAREFPKSAVRQVFDGDVISRGFNTLTNLPYLTRIAATVTDQASYEGAVEAYDLAGDRPEQIRARAYIRAMADLVEAETANPTQLTSSERGALRFAQHVMDDLAADPGTETFSEGPMDAAPMDEHDLNEAAMPHDENSEELASITSPASGEELVVELGAADAGMGMDDALESDGVEPSMGGSSIPNMESFQHVGQLADFDDGMDDVSEETVTVITDPTSGQDLELTLRVIEDAGEADAAPGIAISDEPLSELGDGFQTDDLDKGASATRARRLFDVYDVDGGVTLLTSRIAAPSLNHALRAIARSMRGDEIDGGLWADPASMQHVAIQLGDDRCLHLVASEIDSEAPKSPAIEGQPDDAVSLPEPGVILSDAKSASARLSSEDVRTICASLNLDAGDVEDALLDGETVRRSAWSLEIDAGDNIVLKRHGSMVRTASLSDMDSAIGDFMSVVATDATRPTTGTLLTAEVPEGAPTNARRMMAHVWQIDADAEGNLRDDGHLEITVRAGKRETARIQRVLQDVFGCRQLTAQQVHIGPPVAPVAPSPQDPGLSQKPTSSQENPPSPYEGNSPFPASPANTIVPMQNGQQPLTTGTQSQQSMVTAHTDPLDQSKMGEAKAAARRRAQEMPAEAPAELPVAEVSALEVSAPMDPAALDPAAAMGGMLDLSSGGLQPQDEDAVRAAMTHFRNMGMLKLEALDKFNNIYAGVLEMYDEPGDPSRSARAAAENDVLRILDEAFAKPAVVPAKEASVASVRRAEMPNPKVNTQQGDAVQVDDDMSAEGDLPDIKVNKKNAPQGTFGDTSFPATNSNPSMGAKKPTPTHDPKSNKGVKLSDPTLKSEKGENKTTKSWDRAFKGSADAVTSSNDLRIACDMEEGVFTVMRGDRSLRVYGSLREAREDAIRRRAGTDSKIVVDFGNGYGEEI